MWAIRVGGMPQGNGLLTGVVWPSLIVEEPEKYRNAGIELWVALFVRVCLLFEKRSKLNSWLKKNN